MYYCAMYIEEPSMQQNILKDIASYILFMYYYRTYVYSKGLPLAYVLSLVSDYSTVSSC